MGPNSKLTPPKPAHTVGRIMPRMDFEEWKRLISSPDFSDRSYAADELPNGPSKAVVSLLVKCLDDPAPIVRACAADTLGALPATKESLAALRTAVVREPNELARSFALSSLGGIGELEDIDLLVEAIRKESGSLPRLHATLGLGFCSLRETVDRLLSYVRRKSPNQRRSAAANTLGEYLTSHRSHVELIRKTVEYVLNNQELNPNEEEALNNLLKQISETYKL